MMYKRARTDLLGITFFLTISIGSLSVVVNDISRNIEMQKAKVCVGVLSPGPMSQRIYFFDHNNDGYLDEIVKRTLSGHRFGAMMAEERFDAQDYLGSDLEVEDAAYFLGEFIPMYKIR